MQLRTPRKLAAAATLTLATCLFASCSATSSSSPEGADTKATSPSPSPAAASVAERFTSPEYGYSVTLPAGWTASQAHMRWDGRAGLSIESFDVDLFVGTGSASSFGAAAKWSHGLASYERFLIALNERTHGDTCPSKPETEGRIAIGASRGVLLEYNCGILINQAATVRRGVGYFFLFRDPGVDAAFNRADHAAFAQILRSVEFPH
jgi:hypothetical protein